MKFITPVAIPRSEFNISHQESILLIGSCFTQNIGEKLANHKFSVNVNPNGIIYNPISIGKTLKRIMNNESYSENELVRTNESWVSFDHHGDYSSLNKEKCLEEINASLALSHTHLKETKTVVITFGSAWVYEYPNVGVVANCHKIPNKEFEKRLLSVKEIIHQFEEVIKAFEYINIVFTVSPIRHSKDGLHENNLSKSILHLSINNLVAQHENCCYFPAYEIVIDELRDYRFYKNDLVHPSDLAIDYVWEKFGECYFNDETLALNRVIKKVYQAVNHKPFNPESSAYQQFVEKQIKAINSISNQHYFLDFSEEKEVLTK